MTDTMQCRVCNETKSLEQFPTHPETRNRRNSECLACVAARMREYRRTHPDEQREQNKKSVIRWRNRYVNDSDFRARVLRASRERRRKRYHTDPEFRKRSLESSKRYVRRKNGS